jgi:hypothetical protein
VRPGISGQWQVCRHERKQGDFHQWIYYDLQYVRHLSAWVDIKIALATVFSGGGRRPVPLSWIIPVDRPSSVPERQSVPALAGARAPQSRWGLASQDEQDPPVAS